MKILYEHNEVSLYIVVSKCHWEYFHSETSFKFHDLLNIQNNNCFEYKCIKPKYFVWTLVTLPCWITS